jgi:hypothetical protein
MLKNMIIEWINMPKDMVEFVRKRWQCNLTEVYVYITNWIIELSNVQILKPDFVLLRPSLVSLMCLILDENIPAIMAMR